MPDNNNLYIFEDVNPIFIFDSSPLLSGFDLSNINAYCFTSSLILNEVKNKNAEEKINLSIEMGKLKIIDAPNEYTEKIIVETKKTGDYKSLSPGDISILSLAAYLKDSYSIQFSTPKVELQLKIITDDFSLQNAARFMNIEIESYKTKGTEKFIQWEAYCPFCFRTYSSHLLGTDCKVCGGIIKRRLKKPKKETC